jgi:hypothetical protein
MSAAANSRAEAFKEMIVFADRPVLGPRRRVSALAVGVVRERVAAWLLSQRVQGEAGEALMGVALLWHDHLHEAHAIAQGIPNADGSMLHAIMHRREPDYWNSKYWWNRVGAHACFRALAGRVLELLAAHQDEELACHLLPGGRWNAAAFVDACEAAANEPGGSGMEVLLEEIQALEFECFIEQLLR